MNAGTAARLIELYASGADPKLTGNHELVRELLNQKLKEFAARTGAFETKASISSVANQQEYELPADKIHVKMVKYDSYKAYKITYVQSVELAELTS